jgi:hypothetical protein
MFEEAAPHSRARYLLNLDMYSTQPIQSQDIALNLNDETDKRFSFLTYRHYRNVSVYLKCPRRKQYSYLSALAKWVITSTTWRLAVWAFRAAKGSCFPDSIRITNPNCPCVHTRICRWLTYRSFRGRGGHNQGKARENDNERFHDTRSRKESKY